MVVLVAFGSFVTTLLGGYAAFRIGWYRYLVLGLAAGLMLGAVGFDLLPEALGQGSWVVFGIPASLRAFVLGFLVLHLVEHTVGIHRGQTSNEADISGARSVGLLAASRLVGHSATRCIPRVFAGFLMYLASADILPRAHRTPATLACTIGGVLFMLVIAGLAN